jgi:hypothetical protein
MNAIDAWDIDRIDVAAKLIYLRYLDNNYQCNWGKEVYLAHIKVWNNFMEFDNKAKRGADVFLKMFQDIANDIKINNFNFDESPIYIDDRKKMINGSHRLSSAIYYNKPIKARIVPVAKHGMASANWNYFKNRKNIVKQGLEMKYLDSMVTEAVRYNNKVKVVSLFPSASGREQECESILNKYGKIICSKDINFKKSHALNFVRHLYLGETWAGSYENRFRGANTKTRYCYPREGRTRIYLVEFSGDPVKCKEDVRGLYNLGKHSVHINDNQEETIRIANIVFNDNSIHCMNNASIQSYDKFNELLNKFKQWIKDNNLNVDDFCISGSSSLSAYGLREGRDLDFLYSGDSINTNIQGIDCHNKEIGKYCHTNDDIIHDPKNHFWFEGVKFCSLDVIKQMKQKRGESKDKADVNLINTVI